jgi:hypothetical protein
VTVKRKKVTRCRNLSFGWRFVGIDVEALWESRPMYPDRARRKAKAPAFAY